MGSMKSRLTRRCALPVSVAVLALGLAACAAFSERADRRCSNRSPKTSTSSTLPSVTTTAPLLPVKFVCVGTRVPRGRTTSVRAQTSPNSDCNLRVQTRESSGHVDGTGDLRADTEGFVEWTLTIGKDVKRGEANVDVTCSLGGASGTNRTFLNVGGG